MSENESDNEDALHGSGAGLSMGLPLHVTAQRVDVGNVQPVDGSSINADLRMTIELQNGETYTVYRTLRLRRDKPVG